MKRIVPLGNNVVLKSIEDAEKSKSGVLIPETAREKQSRYLVVYVGAGVETIKPNDIVYCNRFAGDEVKVEDDMLKIVNIDAILGKEIETLSF